MRELTSFEKEVAENARPISWKVLLLMEPVDEFADETKLIKKPDSSREKEQISQDKGRIIAVGPAAFEDPDVFGLFTPQCGDRVLVNRHSGGRVLGYYQKTGNKAGVTKKEEIVEIDLRVVNDKDINNILSEEKKVIFE